MAMVELERALQLADSDGGAAATGLVVYDTAKVNILSAGLAAKKVGKLKHRADQRALPHS